jgi:hypothetical protein
MLEVDARISSSGARRFGQWSRMATVLVVALSCAGGDASTLMGPVANPLDLAVVQVTPDAVTIPGGGSYQFTAVAILPDSVAIVPDVIWTATGGTITSSGVFTAGTTPGTYQISAQLRGHSRFGSAPVKVATTLTSLALNPAAVTLAAGAVQQFVVAGTWSDGSTTVPAATYTVTGGTITASGLYTAGTTPGTFSVIATQQGGSKADTAIVNNIAAPAVILLQMVLSPAAAALAPAGTAQFTVAGTWSDGNSIAPAVTYSATGGTITGSGLYTAGATAGTYRVIAAQSGGTKADTATVTINPSSPTLTTLVLNPGSVSIVFGATQQFSVSGSWSDGTSTAPPVTYTANGGTITASGLYTAGTTAGTFRVIAIHQGGAKADTSIVVIAAPSPTLTKLTISPKSLTLAPNGVQQFRVSGSWSDGSTTVPAAIYAATGGIVTADGSYIANVIPGTYAVVAQQPGAGKADTALVTINGLWGADMETGTLQQWEDNVYQPMPCGGQFNSGPSAIAVASKDFAHSGTWSAKMTIGSDTIGTENGTRLFRWCESRRNVELYYSVWYYIPQLLTVLPHGWTNVFQFKSKTTTQNDPFFFLGLTNAADGSMRFMLTWWNGLTIEGPSPGESGYRTWQNNQTIPVGRWFNVQARYVCAGDFTGALQVWQDGVQIFNLSGVRTRYPTGDCQWSVNNYGSRISPSPVVIYVDDAAISTSKIGPP